MLTSYYKKQLMDSLAGQNSSGYVNAGYYLGLSTTTPTVGTATGTGAGTVADCNFTEPSDSAYSRIYYNKSGSGNKYPFDYPTGTTTFDTVSNSLEIHFNVANESWGTITHVGFFDSNNHLLAFTALNNPITVDLGYIATILVGDAVISLEPEE